jgi:hypothetical protein
VCWVADYRDPYAQHRKHAEWTTPLSVSVAMHLERRMMADPTIVIANTDTEADVWKSRYPRIAGRVHVIWNGYDPDDDLFAAGIPERPWID